MATILVVEDEPHQRELYRMELEDEGHRVVTAADGREALRQVGRCHPDLVVLDLRLPVMDGLESLERMVWLNPRLPVIIYSAYERFKDRRLTGLAVAYLMKSSNLEVLKEEIERVLREQRQRGKVWPQIRASVVAGRRVPVGEGAG